MWSSRSGGCQLNSADVVPVTEAVKFLGGAVGTVRKCFEILSIDNSYNDFSFTCYICSVYLRSCGRASSNDGGGKQCDLVKCVCIQSSDTILSCVHNNL